VLDGVASSAVVITLVSEGVTGNDRGFAALAKGDRLDCLLLEWELILALHDAGRIAKVYPVLIGKARPDGTHSDFFTDGSLMGDAVPDRPSEKTFQEAAKFLAQIIPTFKPSAPQIFTIMYAPRASRSADTSLCNFLCSCQQSANRFGPYGTTSSNSKA
jgi:hypothetical protein